MRLIYMGKKKIIPIFWDFDLTVSQQYQQIPLFESRFEEIKKKIKSYGLDASSPLQYFDVADSDPTADQGIAYLQHMIWDAQKGGCLEGLTKSELFEMGKKVIPAKGFVSLLKNLEEQFFGKVEIHHYFISVGIKEMMEGFFTQHKLKKYCQGIAASSFFVDEKGVINGIKNAVLPFTKNEWVIGFMKGSHKLLNTQLSPRQYKYDYKDMIVIGDGFTDTAKFAYAKKKGGTPVAVYKPEDRAAFEKAKRSVGKWIDYLLPQDYTKDSRAYSLLCEIITQKLKQKTTLSHALLHEYKKKTIRDKEEKELVERKIQTEQECKDYFLQTIVTPKHIIKRTYHPSVRQLL